MKRVHIFIAFVLILFIASCASTPEPEPEVTIEVEPEPAVEPVVIEEPTAVEEPVVIEEPTIEVEPVYVPEPLDEELLLKAKKEIFKAKEARADSYFPGRLNALNDKLAEATSLKDEDPDRARELLLEITEESKQLILDSQEALKVACIKILNDQTEKLIKIQADKYAPVEFSKTQNHKSATLDAFKIDDFTNSIALYRVAYTSATNLYNSLSTNLGYISNLLRLINNYKAEGIEIEVETWANTEYQLAVDSYMRSYKLLYKDYDAVNGEASLRETLFLAKKAVAQAKINIEVSKTDLDIMELMGELEKASTLTVLDREDNIINPEEWQGKADLKDKPIEAEVEKETESGLKEIDLEKDVEVEYPIVSGQTEVLGVIETRKTLLAEAKELWNLSIEARNSGDLISAREYLAKSKVYLEEYKSMAVDYIYTVILNTEKRDCLWRIAEKEEFYGNPFLWQNIWERNKKLIQDPDLIYPGWKLIIPPLN